MPSEGSAREVLSSDTQVPSSGPACDQGLPPVCTGHHWAARGLLYHVHPPGGPGDFHRAPPQAGRHSLCGLRAGLPRDCRQLLTILQLLTYRWSQPPQLLLEILTPEALSPSSSLERIRKVKRKKTPSGGHTPCSSSHPARPPQPPESHTVLPTCHHGGRILTASLEDNCLTLAKS